MRLFPTIAIGMACCLMAAAEPVEQVDLFLAGRDGYHTYRIPSLLTAKNGAVLAFCEGRKGGSSDAGDIDVLMKRSTNGGKSWSEQRVIWDDEGNTCGNPCPVLDEETGTIWLLLTRNRGEDRERDIMLKKSVETRTVWVCHSMDHGESWSAPVEITPETKDAGWGWYATGPGAGIQIRHGPNKGRLVIPCDHSYDAPEGGVGQGGMPVEYGAHAIFSDDHGKTWKLGGVIRPKMNECQAVELADGEGTLLMNMRSYFGRSRRAHSWSRDGGTTWSAPEDHPGLIEPVCQASILRYSWPGEGTRSVILFSNPADEKQRRKMQIRVSLDEGRKWSEGETVHAGPAAYSCLAVLPGGETGLLYERGEQGPYEKVTFARFGAGWLGGEADGKRHEAENRTTP